MISKSWFLKAVHLAGLLCTKAKKRNMGRGRDGRPPVGSTLGLLRRVPCSLELGGWKPRVRRRCTQDHE